MLIRFDDGIEIEVTGEYPIEEGIINCLPEYLHYETKTYEDAKNFIDIHKEVMKQNVGGEHLLTDKVSMSKLQKEFYDTASQLYQNMDDNDKASGGIHWMRIRRNLAYDLRQLNKKSGKMLYVGAGNCRLANLFVKTGFHVVATDISKNILQVGKKEAEAMGVDKYMAFIAHNAEYELPFEDNSFDVSFGACTANHVTDWDTFFTEKIRVVKPGGVILERMPNSKLKWFWDQQTDLNDAVEIKALYCNRDSVNACLSKIPKITYKVWTQDRIHKIIPNSPPFRAWRKYSPSTFIPIMNELYKFKAFLEDTSPMTDDEGIYTIARIVKKP